MSDKIYRVKCGYLAWNPSTGNYETVDWLYPTDRMGGHMGCYASISNAKRSAKAHGQDTFEIWEFDMCLGGAIDPDYEVPKLVYRQ